MQDLEAIGAIDSDGSFNLAKFQRNEGYQQVIDFWGNI